MKNGWPTLPNTTTETPTGWPTTNSPSKPDDTTAATDKAPASEVRAVDWAGVKGNVPTWPGVTKTEYDDGVNAFTKYTWPKERGDSAKLQSDAGWIDETPPTPSPEIWQTITTSEWSGPFVEEERTLMPSSELAHAFTKEPEVQARETLWPNDRGDGSRYYCGYQNAMNYVLLCGPYDTIEEAQQRYEVAWERFSNDPALAMSFPVAFRDKQYMTVLTQPFTAALRKGSYGRL